MKIYLDNCCFNRPYDDQSQTIVSLESQAKLYIQDLIRDGKVTLVSSYILMYENSQNPYDMRRKGISDFISRHTSEYVDYDRADEISEKVSGIMATGVKTKDAHHVACAILASCECFLTTDKRLLKYRSDEIRLLNPIEFVAEWEEKEVA